MPHEPGTSGVHAREDVNARGPWREPPEETAGLFGPFVVHDSRVTGSITFGATRLPVWAPYWPGPEELGDFTHPGDPLEEWQEAATVLVRRLLGLRGEFARLLLVLAAAEDGDDSRFDEAFTAAADDEPFTPPPAWWDVAELRDPVAAQLRACLACLEPDDAWAHRFDFLEPGDAS